MSVEYTKKTWYDGSEGGTPITAAELNRVETGIDDVVTQSNADKTNIDTHLAKKVNSSDGAHGLRYYNSELDYYDDTNEEWVEIQTGGGGGSASTTTYDNTDSGLQATNVQDAIDELADGSGSGDYEDLTNLPSINGVELLGNKAIGLLSGNIQVDSDKIGYNNAISGLSATNVKSAIDEVVGEMGTASMSATSGQSNQYTITDGNVSANFYDKAAVDNLAGKNMSLVNVNSERILTDSDSAVQMRFKTGAENGDVSCTVKASGNAATLTMNADASTVNVLTVQGAQNGYQTKVTASTTDLTPGTSSLETGFIYVVYEQESDSMAKKMYVGVSDVARKVSKMYVGINGVARKIKKAYVGVGGVARLFFTLHSGNFTKRQIQTRNALDEAASAHNTNYVLIGGGEARAQSASSTTANTTVDAFDNNLTRTACEDLSVMRGSRGASSENYAMIASQSSTVNIYNNNLAKQTMDISIAQSGAPGGDTLNHCVFGANANPPSSTSGTMSALVCINKSTLAITNATGLNFNNSTIFDPAGCSRFKDDWYTLGLYESFMQHYDKNLTKLSNISITNYTTARVRMGVGATSDYLFCGGGATQTSGANATNSAFCFDANLTGTALSPLGGYAYALSATGNDEYCFFINGGSASGSSTNIVTRYNSSLTRSTSTSTYAGLWSYGAIEFKGNIYAPNGRYNSGGQSYNSGNIDVWIES